MVRWFAKEEIGHKDLILVVLVILMSENVGTLDRLRTEAKDVEDY